jgi:hydroxysqualene synthase
MRAVPIDHYENFPVASWLCPPALRPAVAAIYWFARTADDLADEGDASPEQRLEDLSAYRSQLERTLTGSPPDPRWASVFRPLGAAVARHQLPAHLLHDLLSAFEQDIVKHEYDNRAQLLDYCRRSANPIGRLLLHLYGVVQPEAQRQSDAICSALQLANFWQDLGADVGRNRLYVPLSDCARHGVDPQTLRSAQDGPAVRTLMAELVQWTRELMQTGAPLVHAVPGRAGWELRLVIQGGLRILERIEGLQYATLHSRPHLTALDALPMLWRAACMRAKPTPLASKPT